MALTVGTVTVNPTTGVVTFSDPTNHMAPVIYAAMVAAIDTANADIKVLDENGKPMSLPTIGGTVDQDKKAKGRIAIAGMATGIAEGLRTVLTAQATVSGSNIT